MPDYYKIGDLAFQALEEDNIPNQIKSAHKPKLEHRKNTGRATCTATMLW